MRLRIKALVGNLLISFVAVVIAWAACEVVVRRSGILADADGPWNKGAKERYRIWLNLEGFRDYQHNVGRMDGVFRIAVVGDSFTWGQGVRAVSRKSLTAVVKWFQLGASSLYRFLLPENNAIGS